jgi:hypothetical protein
VEDILEEGVVFQEGVQELQEFRSCRREFRKQKTGYRRRYWYG